MASAASSWPVHGQCVASAWPDVASLWPVCGRCVASSWPVFGKCVATLWPENSCPAALPALKTSPEKRRPSKHPLPRTKKFFSDGSEAGPFWRAATSNSSEVKHWRIAGQSPATQWPPWATAGHAQATRGHVLATFWPCIGHTPATRSPSSGHPAARHWPRTGYTAVARLGSGRVSPDPGPTM